MSLKKVFSTIAAAAIAVGGLAVGASTASAAQATFGSTITLTATDKAQLEGHTFSAIRLADYTSDENGYVSVTTVGSDDKENSVVYKKVAEAAQKSNGGVAVPEGVDPIAYISGAIASRSALTDDDQTLSENNGTSAKPWTGQVRDFVNDLTDDDTLKNAAAAVELGEVTGSDENGYSADLNMGTAGLYLIFDTTDPVTGQDVNAIPMLVGTSITNASNKFVDDSGTETDQWPSTYMGTVAIKNQTTTVSKTVNGKKQISASIGDTVNYTVKAPLPTTTGFSSTNKYNFTLTDTPGVGQNVTIDTNKGVADATFKVFVDVSGDGKYDDVDGDVLLPRITTNSTEANGYKLKYTNNGEGVTAPSEFVGGGEVGFIVDLANFVSSEDYQAKGYAGKNIVVQYQATITANAPSAGVLNAVEVNSQNAVAQDQTEITYGGFSFTKTDATGNDLTGAKFAIKNSDDKYLKQDDKGSWKEVDDASASERDGDVADGEKTATFTYTGLADGTYTVEETQTPTGYMSNAKVTFKVTIKNGVAVYFDETDKVNFNNDKGSADGTGEITGYKVKNYKSISQLPLTGGAGIALFTVVGLLLIGAGVTVHMRNRNSSQALRY